MAKIAKKKKWYNILLGHIFPNKKIGETLASEPKLLLNRVVPISAIEVSDNLEKYYLKLYFRILKYDNSNAYAFFDKMECLRDYIARMVVRRVTRIDAIKDVKTKDNYLLRVKMIIVVKGKITKSIKKALRKKAQELAEQIAAQTNLEKLIKDLLNDAYAKNIQKELSRIYPIKKFEFRKVEVLERPSKS